jgi:hypothetical protein
MEFALNEVKIQAKKLLKSLKVSDFSNYTLQKSLNRVALVSVDDLKLKHCLTLVSQQLGFVNWQEAQSILTGKDQTIAPKSFGTFFYPESCGGFINEWFSDYQQATIVLEQQPKNKWLLPYKKQFLVVGKEYIKQFDLEERLMPLWREVKHDMVKTYNTVAWDELCCGVIKSRTRVD